MTNKANNKQKQSTNEKKKNDKYGKATNTPQVPLVTGYEVVKNQDKDRTDDCSRV